MLYRILDSVPHNVLKIWPPNKLLSIFSVVECCKMFTFI